MTLSPEDHKKRDDAVKQLVKDIEAVDYQEVLDELVHDAKSGEAMAINNEGVEAQVKFLVEVDGLEKAEKEIRACLGIKKQEG